MQVLIGSTRFATSADPVVSSHADTTASGTARLAGCVPFAFPAGRQHETEQHTHTRTQFAKAQIGRSEHAQLSQSSASSAFLEGRASCSYICLMGMRIASGRVLGVHLKRSGEHQGPIVKAHSIAQCEVGSCMSLRIVPFALQQVLHL